MQIKYEEQNEEEISTIPSVNDLLEQNETSEDEIMHDQVGQNAFKNLDKDQIMLADDLDYSSVRDRSSFPAKEIRERGDKESKVIPIMKQSPEVHDLYVLGRCSDARKLICLICMRESLCRLTQTQTQTLLLLPGPLRP